MRLEDRDRRPGTLSADAKAPPYAARVFGSRTLVMTPKCWDDCRNLDGLEERALVDIDNLSPLSLGRPVI